MRYLRVSVTDRCNLRCRYCMPAAGIERLRREDILSYEQIAAVARAAVALGVTSVRLTGGEPLVSRGIADLVSLLAGIEGLADLSMTSNGLRLAESAATLARAGLQRVNISIDALDAAEYAHITRGGDLGAALEGVRASLAAGLIPTKVNAVVMPGRDFDALRRWMEPFAELAHTLPVHVRFIELMPVAGANTGETCGADLARAMSCFGGVRADNAVAGSGPARYWRLDGAPGTLGVIAPISEPFCDTCNRLRLTARGELRRCIFSTPDVNLRPLLVPGPDETALAAAISHAWRSRPAGRGPYATTPDSAHALVGQAQSATASMCQIGG